MRQASKTVSSKDDAGVSGGYIDKMTLQSGAGILFSLFGYNSGSAQWIHIHDAASQPANGTVPMHTFKIGATDNYSVIIPLTGINFSKGCQVCVSTTGPTTTIGAKEVTMLATLLA
jgi:hypothetical protein